MLLSILLHPVSCRLLLDLRRKVLYKHEGRKTPCGVLIPEALCLEPLLWAETRPPSLLSPTACKPDPISWLARLGCVLFLMNYLREEHESMAIPDWES